MNARQFKKLREQVRLAAKNMVRLNRDAFLPAIGAFGEDNVTDMIQCVVNHEDGYSRMRCLQEHCG